MRKILFIGGSLNQTTIAHAVAQHLEGDFDCYFSPYYVDGVYEALRQMGLLDFTVVGGNQRRRTERYLEANNLRIDYGGENGDYDMYVMASDVLLPRNVLEKPMLLIQEGMTDPEGVMYHLIKTFNLPLFLGGTSTAGLSDAYDYFCVASEGYRELFISKGVRPEKLKVTGIPNFDNVEVYRDNDFPYRDFVLVATSDSRETFKKVDKTAFLEWAVELAAGRPMIFKLHPNENFERSTAEIRHFAPDALVLTDGNTEQMIANSQCLITEYSSCTYVGLALGKEVHSEYFDIAELRKLLPLQNGGASGYRISQIARQMLEEAEAEYQPAERLAEMPR